MVVFKTMVTIHDDVWIKMYGKWLKHPTISKGKVLTFSKPVQEIFINGKRVYKEKR